MASLIADVQSAYTGDEWGGGDEEDTVHSWENVGDVFPEAPREMEMALRWKEGKHDDELVQFLSELLGMPVAEDKSNNNDDDDDRRRTILMTRTRAVKRPVRIRCKTC
jgi:hypothetical protein